MKRVGPRNGVEDYCVNGHQQLRCAFILRVGAQHLQRQRLSILLLHLAGFYVPGSSFLAV
jgi:hypothetical protein